MWCYAWIIKWLKSCATEQISQGSVVTDLRRGGRFYCGFFTGINVVVLLKSVHIGQSYSYRIRQKKLRPYKLLNQPSWIPKQQCKTAIHSNKIQLYLTKPKREIRKNLDVVPSQVWYWCQWCVTSALDAVHFSRAYHWHDRAQEKDRPINAMDNEQRSCFSVYMIHFNHGFSWTELMQLIMCWCGRCIIDVCDVVDSWQLIYLSKRERSNLVSRHRDVVDTL